MSKYFCIVDGKALDFVYKKHTEKSYVFYIDNIFVGQIFKSTCGSIVSWTAVGRGTNSFNMIEGLRTRHDAAQNLLVLEGY